MPDTMLDVLDDARTALLPLGPPVLLAGDPEPENASEVIVLQDVSQTARPAYGLQPSTKLIQVSVYAETKARALELDASVTVALRPSGLRFVQSRPAPDPDHIGQISDYWR